MPQNCFVTKAGVSLYVCFMLIEEILDCFLAQAMLHIIFQNMMVFSRIKFLCNGVILLLRCPWFLMFLASFCLQSINNTFHFHLLQISSYVLSRSWWPQVYLASYVRSLVAKIFIYMTEELHHTPIRLRRTVISFHLVVGVCHYRLLPILHPRKWSTSIQSSPQEMNCKLH